MGRSKFPGKPSKHCHRKRVNVLPTTRELNVCSNDASSLTSLATSKENKQEDDLSENESDNAALTEKLKVRRNQVRKKLNNSICVKGRRRKFMTKIRNKSTLNNRKTQRKLVRNDTTNFAGKFILPTRSVHSSRVIKPNKRFIDLNETINIKQKILTKKRTRKSIEEINNDSKDTLAYSNGHKVILRQARLKLPSQGGSQMQFTTKLHNGPGTIICGVCGAVRYYRFVKQARKFNIYSCESCRKFISKQIKRLNIGTKGSNVLSCQIGQGTCYVPPVVRSQHWKIAKCAYRSRCSACWLKMCIRAYHLPVTLKQNLTELLPDYMQGFDFSFNDSLPPILWQKHIDSPDKTIKQRPIRFKAPQKNRLSQPIISSNVKRQKIDLKGPRVKHVCRSASIVLGQPIATFSNDLNDKKINTDSQDSISEKSTLSDVLKSDLYKIDSNSVTDEESASNSGSCKSYFERNRKERFKRNEISLIKEASLPPEELPHWTGILLNYPHELNYENRFRNGFSILTSKEVTINSACFLCGSAGIEYMLICAVCCELYHSFCIENFRVSADLEYWICFKCAPCHKCKSYEKSKVTCPKCLKMYHIDCFNNKEDVGNTKLICNECMQCQNCGTTTAYNLTGFPGNRPLCLNCISKDKVGMKCPICQYSIDEDISNLKMLTCSKCKKWVHSKCEKLTSEQYDISKLLPLSASFTCSQCLNDAQSTLLGSIQNELFLNFNKILKLLMKNKVVRSVLKNTENKDICFRRQLLTSHSYIDNNNYDIFSFDESEKYYKEMSFSLNAIVDIKNKLKEYKSVKKFNNDMKEALKLFHSEQIFMIYKSIFQSVFPWFSQSHETDEDAEQSQQPDVKCKKITLKMPDLPKSKNDDRLCVLCHVTGDQLCHQESRLLFCGNDKWVHANCAYWSTNVYEDLDNHLQNVIETIEKNKFTKCFTCEKLGATLQCSLCKSDSFHFMCARKSNFIFTTVNKGCFCSKHALEKTENIIKENDDFELNRSIFVEQYSNEGFRSDPEKILCAIGSLLITTLGKIEPFVSDTTDALIPTGYSCTKIFWSTIEPWRLVTYLIKTSILNPNCSTLSVDKNFTIDHSLGRQDLEKAVKDLCDWQKVYNKKPDSIESEDEEERNASELLSPELTDTILEDLPNDILDGILVHDLFPNFNYDDMLGFDNSNTESIPDGIKKIEDDHTPIEQSDLMPGIKECNRSKSDLVTKSRVPPLSLTLSYKFDTNITSISKKRKIHKDIPSNMLLLQVDGNFDDDSSSDCNTPSINDNAVDPWTISEQPVTCEKCQCTYRTQASYTRHLDTCEVLCMSESDSEVALETDVANKCEESPTVPTSQPVEVTVQVNETPQPVFIQAYESYQSQVHTSVVNVVPEPCPLSQSQSVTIQPTITLSEPQQTPTISIPVPLCVTPQIVQPSLDFQQSQSVALQPLQQMIMSRPPQATRRETMVLQQIPSAPTTGFVPYVDAFGQTQTNQSVQYVQIASQVQPQTQILQIRSDGNVIGILPSIQPTTVIVQQPQQLVLDSSGAFGWAQQPQHQIYYGFETIVQNTVMQSQQFLPTPVPGVLTANSSYSTTTQVFQTSKLEPVLDVPSNGYVLVNPNKIELPQQFPQQTQSAAIVNTQTPTVIYSQQSAMKKSITPSSNCINLPTTPYISDQNIPMNIVPPIPKPPASHRPMNRVLPMQTNTSKSTKNITDISKIFPEIEKPMLNKIEDKFVNSKDFIQVLEHPRTKNKNIEILDYKFIKSRNHIANTDLKKNAKINEKSFRKCESVNKITEIIPYEPLQEIEMVEREILNEPIKALLNKDKYLKFNVKKKLNEAQPRNFNHLDLQYESKNDGKSNIVQKRHFELIKKRSKMENSVKKPCGELSIAQNPSPIRKDLSVNSFKKTQFQFGQRNETKPLQTSNSNFKILPKSLTKDKLNATNIKKSLDMPKLDDIDSNGQYQLESNILLNVDNNIVESQNISLESNHNLQASAQESLGNTTKLPAVITPLRVLKNIKNEVNEKPKFYEKINNISTNSVLKPQSKKETNYYGAPAMLYTIEDQEGFKCSSTSISECWAKVWEAVQNARTAHNMPPLPTDGKQFKSVQLMGLKSSQIKYLLEQLPGASKCIKYKSLFSFSPHLYDTVDSSSHEFGAVRCRPHLNRNTDPNDMFSWLSSKHRKPFMMLDGQTIQSRRVNSFPLAMKFRNLKQTSRWSVGVYRSDIHGKGLFCLRDIEAGEMVIEYAGEVIRSILTDKREKYYNSKAIGCYMFRVDDNLVIDATMKGNAARFINHSCDPNCYSKVVEIQGHKHIIIFALRRISSGEELTYDYKFPFEEDKIPCTCGARKCRKFLN